MDKGWGGEGKRKEKWNRSGRIRLGLREQIGKYGLEGAIEDREGILLVGTDDDDDDETEGTGDSCLFGHTTWLDCMIPPALSV